MVRGRLITYSDDLLSHILKPGIDHPLLVSAGYVDLLAEHRARLVQLLDPLLGPGGAVEAVVVALPTMSAKSLATWEQSGTGATNENPGVIFLHLAPPARL